MKNRKILISGAGIAGPTLAYWLRRYGFEPTLVERSPALRDGGYMVDFWGRGFDVAEKMALLKELRRYSYEIDEVRLVDEVGERTGGLDARAFQRMLGERYLSILRSDLARIIYKSLHDSVRTIFGDAVTGIRQDDDGPEAHYEKYLGYYAASFALDSYPRKDPRAYVSYAAPGRQVSRYSLRDDRTVFFFVFSGMAKLPTGQHDLNAQKKMLRDVFGRDRWECPAILSALDSNSDLYFDSVSQIRMEAWSRKRVALIGDACFCPSLLAGQGTALAMTGAYILAGELKKEDGDYQAAFRSYENIFWPIVIRKQRAAARFASSFAPRTEFGIFVRSQVTRLMSLPFVSDLALGRLLSDPLALPDYRFR